MNEVVGLISNVGFPITAFLLMYRMARETIRENTEALQDLRKEMEASRPHHTPATYSARSPPVPTSSTHDD